MQQNQQHYDFISTTDRKSLHTQIKGLVAKAQEVSNIELKQRRAGLQRLLEYEDDIYEKEFANKVKSRIDEDIKERKNVLLKIKEENEQSAHVFLQKKRVQQYMESCYEIREALQHKDQQNVKACLLEQMLEKERNCVRTHELDKYWESVLARNQQREDHRGASDECIKRKLAEQNRFVLDAQLQEHAEQRQQQLRERQDDVEKLNKLLEELRLEKFDRLRQGLPPKMVKYRQEQLDLIAERKVERDAAEEKRLEEERLERCALERLAAEEKATNRGRRLALQQATLEYIAYVRRLRQLEETALQKRYDRIDDLQRIDQCTKGNIQLMRDRKAAEAERCHAELRRQMCEQHERRLREEAERRECKMLENRFARPEVTRLQVLEQRRKNRAALDAQVAELQRIRAAEEASYTQDLKRASNDHEFCARLAEKYMAEGVDYLEPHPNWHVIACPNYDTVPKPAPALTTMAVLMGEGDTCIVPCGCAKVLLSGVGCGRGAGDGMG